jgi:hypothetical protein
LIQRAVVGNGDTIVDNPGGEDATAPGDTMDNDTGIEGMEAAETNDTDSPEDLGFPYYEENVG